MSEFQDYLDKALKQVTFTASSVAEPKREYDIYGEIRTQIIQAREDAHLTQKDLAALSGLTQSNISNIENGITHPTLQTLKKIADALGKRLTVDLHDQNTGGL